MSEIRESLYPPSGHLVVVSKEETSSSLKGRAAMTGREPVVEYSLASQFMRDNLHLVISVLASSKGNEVPPDKLDFYLGQFSESDVCLKCKIDAAFEVQERLRDYRKTFIKAGASPYLSKIGKVHGCTCKRPRTH